MKKAIFICIIISLVILLGTCNIFEKPKTNEDLAIQAVEDYGASQYILSKIGNNDLKSSKFTVTTIKYESEYKYTVYGHAIMVDVYNRNWDNDFSCNVVFDTEENEWEVKNFKYKYKNWT